MKKSLVANCLRPIFVSILVVSCLLVSTAHARPAEVILIRHAEKPDDGDGLSEKGWARARALPRLLERPDLTRFGKPVELFGMVPTKNRPSRRALETLKYAAEALGLAINSNYSREQYDDLANEILENPDYNEKAVWVCWEHKVLIEMAKALGVKETPEWPDEQFDRAWVLDFDRNDKVTLSDLPERLLPGDSDK